MAAARLPLSIGIWLALACLATPLGPAAPTMSSSDIAPGMKGRGRTVFEGTRVQEFEVEIIGVMKNILPKKDLILARLAGGPLADTGVLQGMSGSPVYIDGKLIGAVAYSWGFSKEPICGITPIDEMLELIDRGLDVPSGSPGAIESSAPPGVPGPISLLADPRKMIAFLKERAMRLGGPAIGSLDGHAALAPLRTTLAFSGYSPSIASEWFPAFEAMSLQPVMAGAAAGEPGSGTPLEPGSAFGVTLVRGDLDVTAIGTVTHVDGDFVVGLGHPFLGLGRTAMPMTGAHVYGNLASLESSAKLAAPTGEIGAVMQDRFAGVAGRVGAEVKMVPVRIEMRRQDGSTSDFRFDIVPHPLLTPGLLHVSLLNLLSSWEKEVGDVTLRLREGSRIQLTDDLEVKLDNLFSGDYSVLYASGTVAYMAYLLLNNEDRRSRIEGINLLFDFEDDRRTARISKIWLESYTAAPGRTLMLHVDVNPYRSKTVTVDIPIEIPAEAPEGQALLQVGDSLTLSRMEAEAGGGGTFFVPRSLEHLVWLLNNIRLNQKIYATLLRPDTGAFIAGQRLPNLPPSVSSLLLRPGSESTESAALRFRTLLESSADTAYTISGYQRALIEIKR